MLPKRRKSSFLKICRYARMIRATQQQNLIMRIVVSQQLSPMTGLFLVGVTLVCAKALQAYRRLYVAELWLKKGGRVSAALSWMRRPVAGMIAQATLHLPYVHLFAAKQAVIGYHNAFGSVGTYSTVHVFDITPAPRVSLRSQVHPMQSVLTKAMCMSDEHELLLLPAAGAKPASHAGRQWRLDQPRLGSAQTDSGQESATAGQDQPDRFPIEIIRYRLVTIERSSRARARSPRQKLLL